MLLLSILSISKQAQLTAIQLMVPYGTNIFRGELRAAIKYQKTKLRTLSTYVEISKSCNLELSARNAKTKLSLYQLLCRFTFLSHFPISKICSEFDSLAGVPPNLGGYYKNSQANQGGTIKRGHMSQMLPKSSPANHFTWIAVFKGTRAFYYFIAMSHHID